MKNINDDFTNLIEYKANIYSQNGEDGVLKEILKRLNLKNKIKWCVEFGAWDGTHLSNTYNLVRKGWKAVYIEGNRKKFNDLLKTKRKNRNIIAINEFVSRNRLSKNSLDNILKRTDIPKDFEILSIDIDSFDLEVWQSISFFDPKIVIIEINSAYPPGIIKWHSEEYSNVNGNSFSATLKVGQDKGYDLICHTGNMIFIKKEFTELINLDPKLLKYPELLFQDKWYSIEKNKYNKFTNKVFAFLKIKIINKIKKLIFK